jgi:two-component system, OmpR family, phosphate regulon response regulator PhoB
MQRILIVEDEHAIRQLLQFILRPAGFETIEAGDAMTALYEVSSRPPGLVLLDRQLPDMDGMRLLRLWRTDEATAQLPVIMVSARITEADRVAGLRAGADDYITKPFSRDELLARIQSVLRRTTGGNTSGVPEIREIAGLALDVRSLRVMVNQKPLPLGPIEFRLLNLFMSQPERALSRKQIVDRVWRSNTYVDERTVDVHIRRLRAVLEPSSHDHLIQTVRGVGYRFTVGVDRQNRRRTADTHASTAELPGS